MEILMNSYNLETFKGFIRFKNKININFGDFLEVNNYFSITLQFSSFMGERGKIAFR